MSYLSTIVLVCMGILIGFLAQRSRMCFVAGIRDYILVRDRELLMGMISFILTIWLLTSLLYGLNILRSGVPEYGSPAIQSAVKRAGTESFDITRLRSLFTGALPGQIRLLLGSRFLYVTLIGGLIIGLVSTLAGGCVLRQHVLLAQGSMDSLFFVAGFYAAVLVYYGFLYRFFIRLY
jgi:uncharacterized membrane protein YedE/YeeE